MAVIVATTVKQSKRDIVLTWSTMLNGDTGDIYTNQSNRFATFQVSGVFGAGGTVVLQGSLDGTNWVTLLDSAGAAISLTAAGFLTVRDIALYYRPNVTAGDGTTDLDCTLLVR